MDNQSPKLSLKDTVYQQLIELICQGKLLPDTLFTENHMISYFGVSKSPVREALIQLCHENVLKSIPRCGYQVTAISSKNVRDVTELRLYLELSSLPKVMVRQLREIYSLCLFKSQRRRRILRKTFLPRRGKS